VRRYEVTNQEKDVHHDVLSDRDHIRTANFDDWNLSFGGSIQIDMIGTNTSGNSKLQIGSLLN
jgi:hypothetical protein